MFKLGDIVKFKAVFLKNTGQYTEPVPFLKGEIVELVDMGSGVWPRVQWPEDYREEPVLVAAGNLMLAGKPDYSGI